MDFLAEQHSILSKIDKKNVLEAINNNFSAKTLLKHYNPEKKLEKDQVLHICDVVCSYFLSKHEKLGPSHSEKIANTIVEVFTGEIPGRFYTPARKTAYVNGKKIPYKRASGPVSNKIKNLGHDARELAGVVKKRAKKIDNQEDDSSFTDDETEDIEANADNDAIKTSLQWLKENEHPYPLLKTHWTNTVDYRRNWILKQTDLTINVIFTEWSVLKNVAHAPELIKIDFDTLYPTSANAISKWNTFIELIRGQYRNASSTARVLLNMIDSISTNDNSKTMAGLLVLAHFLPPNVKVKGLEKENPVKSKIAHCKNSLVQHIEDDSEQQSLEEEETENAQKQPIQPHLIAVGKEISAIEKFYVKIDDKKYGFDKCIDAIDFCFKSFFILNADYPPVSRHIWILIQQGLYNIKTDYDDVDSEVSNLIDTLEKCRA